MKTILSLVLSTAFSALAVAENQQSFVSLSEDNPTIVQTEFSAEGSPGLFLFRPQAPQGKLPVLLIFPGGGYQSLAIEHEGRQPAQWAKEQGFFAAVLRYRFGRSHPHPQPLKDAVRAIKLLREHADEWGLDRERIAVLGFSAGGHLASMLGTLSEENPWREVAGPSLAEVRPSFLILVYPLISFTAADVPASIIKNHLGLGPDLEQLKKINSDQLVTEVTPPTLLIHAADDAVVGVSHSEAFFHALRAKNRPAELHIFEKGGHGFGLGKERESNALWPQAAKLWLKR